MKREPSPRKRVTAIILVLVGIVWFSVAFPLFRSVGLLEAGAWSIIVLLVLVIMILASLSRIRPATMVLSTFQGDIDKLDSRKGNTTRGIAGTHFVLNFPPQLAEAIYLPLGIFIIPFKPVHAVTKEQPEEVKNGVKREREAMTRVVGMVQITAQLPTDLEGTRDIIEVIDFISGRKTNNLAKKVPMKVYRKKEDGSGAEQVTEDCFQISETFAAELQPTIDEALSQVLPRFTLREVLKNRGAIETAFIEQLKEGKNEDGSKREASVIQRAGLLNETKLNGLYFNLNIVDIIVADSATLEAISSGATESYKAVGAREEAKGQRDAQIIRSEGTAQAIRNQSAAVQEGGDAALQVLAGQAIKDAAASSNTTFVAGLDILQAGAAAIVKQPPNQPNKPKT